MKLFHYNSIDSTNLEAQRLLKTDIKLPFALIADYQTNGKGQGTNSWASEKGLNLTCTFVIEPFIKASSQYLITVATSVSIFQVLNTILDTNKNVIKIKWPNDIYVDDNKICGILVANKVMGDSINISIIGIGLNVNQTKFSSNIPNPTSLKLITKNSYDILDVFEIINNCFVENINIIQKSPEKLVSIYRNNLYKIGQPSLYTINGKKQICTIKDIDNFGNIIFAEDNIDNKR